MNVVDLVDTNIVGGAHGGKEGAGVRHPPTTHTKMMWLLFLLASSTNAFSTIVSGSPSLLARAVDVRAALRQPTVYRLDGSPTSLALSDDGISLICLTRSFG